MDRPLVVLDTETATVQGAPHLLELGAVRVVAGEVADEFEALVRPEVAIEPEASAVHGIREEDVRGAAEAAEVLAAFRDWVGDDWMAAHNAPFDARVLGFEYARRRLAPPPGPLIDSLALARRHLPDAPDHKLATLTQVLELEDGPAHRALSDAVYCWKVIEACLERAQGGPSAAAELLGRGAPLTIAAAAPPSPPMARRLRPIEAALEAGASVTLLYGEGAEPPARIEVRPRFLYRHRGKGYLEAECARSDTLKTYRLDRVRRVLAAC